MKSFKLHLIRHGVTAGNLQGLLNLIIAMCLISMDCIRAMRYQWSVHLNLPKLPVSR